MLAAGSCCRCNWKTNHQVKTERVQERIGALSLERGGNLETTGSQDDGERNPETTIRGQRGGTKGVADSHLPHTSQELDKTTITVGNGDNEVRLTDAQGAHVNQRQHKGGESESGQSKRRRVGEVLLRSAVEARLEFTAESRQTQGRVIGSDVGERVAAIVVGAALLGQIASVVNTGGAVGAVDLLGDFLLDC